MSIKITIPNSSSDVLTFGSGNTPTAAQIAGIDSGSSNGQLALYTTASGTSTERVRVDASGNVGIGTSSPNSVLDVKSPTANLHLTSTTGTNLVLYRAINTGGTFFVGRENSTGSNFGAAYSSLLWSTGAYPMVFATNDVERARIDSSGNLLVGLTSQSGTAATLAVSSGLNNGNAARIGLTTIGGSSGGSNYPQIGYNTAFTSTTTINYLSTDTASWIRFSSGKVETFTAASGTGGTAISATTGPYVALGGISWTNGSSDVRQKKNFEPTQGLAEILQVEPIKYHFNWEDDTAPKKMGFKAQNLLPLIPEMVVEKDEKAEDGSPYLTITPDYMLPVLVKAIQEQQAIIQTLTDRITALENK